MHDQLHARFLSRRSSASGKSVSFTPQQHIISPTAEVRPVNDAIQRRAEMMLKASDKYEAAMIDVDEKYLDGDDVQEATGAEVRSVKASKPASARITPTQAATLMLGLSSRVDALPRIYDGPRYEREYRLADITVWPDYDVVILGEHAGVVREHFGQTFRAASVCNRPTMMAPSALCDHIIGDYVRFMKVYPHVPRLVLGHPTCDPMNKASHRTRADKIASGTAWNLVRDSVDMRAHARRGSRCRAPGSP